MGNMVVKLFINLNSISLAHLRRECTDPITESIPPVLIASFPPPCPPICPPLCPPWPPWPLVLPNHLSGLYLSTPRAREGGTNMRKSWKFLIFLFLLFFFNKCLSLQHPCPEYSPQSTPASFSLPAIHSAPTIHITVWSGTQILYHLLNRCRNPTAPLLRGHNVTRAASTCVDL